MKNKKRFAIPLICIAAALCLIILITVFATPLSYYICEMRFADKYTDVDTSQVDVFYTAKKCGKIMNLVYKINPSDRNLEVLQSIYSPKMCIYGMYYGQEVPKDYKEKCVYYSKIMYDTPYNEKTMTTVVPVVPDVQKQWKIANGIEYATALYILGDTAESRNTAEEVISLIDDDTFVMALTIKDYFYYVYATTTDETLKAWVLDKENILTEKGRENEKFGAYFRNHDKPYTNPDLDTYIKGPLPEDMAAQ
ncbi:MAG: hypothetical protein E7514_07005 [Ruminococcaceae bacterium]|nr:hypothetical protein [Oscillospiraceae bacterium]